MGQLIKPDEDALHLTYGLVCMVVFCVGGVVNSVTLTYFLSKSKKGDIPNFLYTSITATDLVLCILVLPLGVSFLELGTSWISGQTICNAWGMVWTFSNQMSIFLILTFSLCRTKALLFPFAKNSIVAVKVAISFYALLMVAQVCLPYFFQSSYSLSREFLICHWDYKSLFGEDSRLYQMIFALFNIWERVVPFVAVLVSCFISYVLLIGLKRAELVELEEDCATIKISWWQKLLCKQRGMKTLNKGRFRQPHDRLKVRATYTILLATVNYTILNLPNVIYMILAFSDLLSKEGPPLLSFDTKNHFATFSLVMCTGFHALVTPIICCCRMAGLRRFYEKVLHKTAALLKCFKEEPPSKRNINIADEDGVIANVLVEIKALTTSTTDRNGPSELKISITERRQSSADNPFPSTCPSPED